MTPISTEELEAMTVEGLKALADTVNAALVEAQAKRRAEVLQQMVEISRVYGITAEDLAEAQGIVLRRLRSRSTALNPTGPARALYRDPVTGAEWAGRGKLPTFIRESGKPKEAFRIRD